MDNSIMINAWNVCLDLIKDRGFSCNKKYSELSREDINHLLNDDKLDILSNNKNGRVLYIHFINTPKVKFAQITATIKYCEELNIDFDLVFVLKPKPNSGIRKLEIRGQNNIQIFWCKQIQFNITKHSLVPIHRCLTEEEKEGILEKYEILYKSQFPIISQQDPIVRWYNYKKGDIIRISRKDSKTYEDIFKVGNKSCLSSAEKSFEDYLSENREINKNISITKRRKVLVNYYETNICDNLLRYRYVK